MVINNWSPPGLCRTGFCVPVQPPKSNEPLNPESPSLHSPPNPSFLCNNSLSTMALHLCRPKHRLPNNPSLFHLFSTTQQNNNDDENSGNSNSNNNNSQKPSLNSYFSDVKARLKKPSSTQTTLTSSLHEIRKNLAEYRQRTAAPPPTQPANSAPASQSQQAISFQEIYKRNQSQHLSNEAKPAGGTGGKLSFDAIRDSLRQMRVNTNSNINNNNNNNANFNARSTGINADLLSTKLGGISSSSKVIGGTEGLPVSVFGREMIQGSDKGGAERDGAMRTEFVKMYSYAELGEKLRQLRPEEKKGAGFSLQELNERLMRLREMEERDSESRLSGVPFRELRESLQRLKMTGDEKQKKSSS